MRPDYQKLETTYLSIKALWNVERESRKQLQQENDELRALLDDYKDFTGLVDFDEKVVTKTISKIKADAINQAVMSHRNDESFKDTFEVLACHGFMFEYAEKLEQDNE